MKIIFMYAAINKIARCILQVETKGLTGDIKFDRRGFRTDFTLDVIELKQEGLVKVFNSFINRNMIPTTALHINQSQI